MTITAGVSGAIARPFRLARMDRIVLLHPSTEAAIAQIAG